LDSFWQIQIMGWGCFYIFNLLESIHNLLTRNVHVDEETVPIFFMFLGSCVLRYFCRRLIRQSNSWLEFELKAAGASVVTAIPVACISALIMQNFYIVPWHATVTVWAWSFFILFMWCSLYFSIKQWQQSSKEKELLLRAETDAREAKLRALRYQLNPHFLFNSLNAVSTLVLDGNAPAATRMLAQIGDLLRTSLDSEIMIEVPLSQEMAFTEQYLAIEQTRLGERLHVEIKTCPETLDALVPSMSLQPLVENAVRHGVVPLAEGGKIMIHSSLCENRLRIMIENTGRRDVQMGRGIGSGVGLKNTAERLKEHYGQDYSFSRDWQVNGNFQVTVELPFRTIASPVEAQSCVQ
jgi:two-component system LytT family sensor kinase